MAAKSKKKTGRKQTKKKKTEQSFLGEEIFVWVTLAVSILLLISNFGFGGNIGDHVSGALKHDFGIVAYFVPFLLFGIVSFLISNIECRYSNSLLYVSLDSHSAYTGWLSILISVVSSLENVAPKNFPVAITCPDLII